MCHFYSNPLSILLVLPDSDISVLQPHLTKDYLNALRSLPSMRNYVQDKLAEKDTVEVKAILFDDEYFTSLLPQFVEMLHANARTVSEAVVVLAALCERAGKNVGSAELYLDTLNGDLKPETPLVREMLQYQRYSLPIPLPQTPSTTQPNPSLLPWLFRHS